MYQFQYCRLTALVVLQGCLVREPHLLGCNIRQMQPACPESRSRPRGTRRHPCQWSLSPDLFSKWAPPSLVSKLKPAKRLSYLLYFLGLVSNFCRVVSVQSSCHHQAKHPSAYKYLAKAQKLLW